MAMNNINSSDVYIDANDIKLKPFLSIYNNAINSLRKSIS